MARSRSAKKTRPEVPGGLRRLLRALQEKINVKDSEIVFVGYGIVAPEYGWDDYKGVDVKGKTILMLINDPAIPDPNNPAQLDPKMFKGRAMTYYGRWTYKYEIAAQKGAVAAVIIHETEPAAYPYSVVMTAGRRRTSRSMPGQEHEPGRCAPGSPSTRRRNCLPTAVRILTR